MPFEAYQNGTKKNTITTTATGNATTPNRTQIHNRDPSDLEESCGNSPPVSGGELKATTVAVGDGVGDGDGVTVSPVGVEVAPGVGDGVAVSPVGVLLGVGVKVGVVVAVAVAVAVAVLVAVGV